MRVLETREDQTAAHVGDPRGGPAQLVDVATEPNRRDAPVANRDGVHPPAGGVGGVHAPTAQDHVGGAGSVGRRGHQDLLASSGPRP